MTFLEIEVGAVIEFPGHKLRVIATEFERDAAFQDAVAQAVYVSGDNYFEKLSPGTHIKTPWGFVQVVSNWIERPPLINCR